MLNITSPVVVDRFANRADNVRGIAGLDLLGRCQLQLRDLMHQMCLASERGKHPRGLGRGFKRTSYLSASSVPSTWPLPTGTPTSTARGVRTAG